MDKLILVPLYMETGVVLIIVLTVVMYSQYLCDWNEERREMIWTLYRSFLLLIDYIYCVGAFSLYIKKKHSSLNYFFSHILFFLVVSGYSFSYKILLNISVLDNNVFFRSLRFIQYWELGYPILTYSCILIHKWKQVITIINEESDSYITEGEVDFIYDTQNKQVLYQEQLESRNQSSSLQSMFPHLFRDSDVRQSPNFSSRPSRTSNVNPKSTPSDGVIPTTESNSLSGHSRSVSSGGNTLSSQVGARERSDTKLSAQSSSIPVSPLSNTSEGITQGNKRRYYRPSHELLSNNNDLNVSVHDDSDSGYSYNSSVTMSSTGPLPTPMNNTNISNNLNIVPPPSLQATSVIANKQSSNTSQRRIPSQSGRSSKSQVTNRVDTWGAPPRSRGPRSVDIGDVNHSQANASSQLDGHVRRWTGFPSERSPDSSSSANTRR